MAEKNICSQKALLTPFGPPGRILDLILSGRVTIAFDDRVLAEYRDVLYRPKFGFDRRAIEEILRYFVVSGYATNAPPFVVSLLEPDDTIFLEVAAAAHAVLITGNLRYYPPDQRSVVEVLLPAKFLDRWSAKPR